MDQLTKEQVIRVFKLSVCPKTCMIKGPKTDEACITRVNKCIKKDGGCNVYKSFVNKLDSCLTSSQEK